MLWSSAAGVFHMAKPSFFDPFTATSLDHPHTLVQQGYNNVQVTYKNVQDKHNNVARPSQKQSSENCRQVELHNHDNWKTVANRVHMCPTVCKWHQTSYKWKQLTSTPKTVKWTSHELTSQEMKIPKLFQLAKTYKHDNSLCSMIERLLQDSWTAPGNKLDNPDNCFLKTASVCSSVLTASVVSWTAYANPCTAKQHSNSNLFLDLFCKSLNSRLLVTLETTKLGEPRGRLWDVLFS